jgi:hypothetical protein
VYWWILQPWEDDPTGVQTPEDESTWSRMGNFLEITLTAQYNL